MQQQPAFLLFAFVVIGAAMGCQPPIHYPEGGYSYPKTVKDSNYYYYPLQRTFSRRDSFWTSMMYISYKAFDEPNLSLVPAKEDIFRLHFDGWKQWPAIITLTENRLVVKRGVSGGYDNEDTNRLNELERFHYRYLRNRYPLEERYAHENPGKKLADSLIKLYPQLVNPAYFKYLLEKISTPAVGTFKYSVIEKSISYKEYYRLVTLINSAGYWKMPHKIPCNPELSDGDGYILEANTKHKYNFVWSYSCPDDTTHFANICQEIIKFAGLDTSIHLVWSGLGVDTTKPINMNIPNISLDSVKEAPRDGSVPAKPRKKHSN